ncbi:MAG: hypothetical protein M1816_000908 [Peltula sp. TS41687]|nr:MAG: hypothetical protein M1816_000908 [Peltula sp. TS41687]
MRLSAITEASNEFVTPSTISAAALPPSSTASTPPTAHKRRRSYSIAPTACATRFSISQVLMKMSLCPGLLPAPISSPGDTTVHRPTVEAIVSTEIEPCVTPASFDGARIPRTKGRRGRSLDGMIARSLPPAQPPRHLSRSPVSVHD